MIKLLFALTFLLALAGVGEAGAENNIFTLLDGAGFAHTVIDEKGNTVLTCEKDKVCVASKLFLERQTCYQRMREALRELDALLRQPSEIVILTDSHKKLMQDCVR